jgi:threonylcarbamoyladenosine tRNA methylthiotransferase MtaB
MSGPEIVTLGCRLNAAESEAMRVLAGDQDDLVIVNSCAVTSEAVRQAKKAIRSMAKRRPDARILVTGCAAQIDPGYFAAMPEVAAVIGNREKGLGASFLPASFHDLSSSRPSPPPSQSSPPSSQSPPPSSQSPPPSSQRRLGSHEAERGTRPNETPAFAGVTGKTGVTSSAWTTERAAKIHVSDIMSAHDTAPHFAASFGTRARAFLEVQNGCDHRCTFCIIPYGRGPSRSVPAGLVVDRVRALVDEGYDEVVLTGVDTTSYGPDLPGGQTLGQLVERVLALVPGLRRLRLSSLDSIEIDDRLFDLVTGDARVQPHLHLSLQSGDDMILKRMKRRHTRRQAIEMVQRLKAARPEIAIGADLIAGFPTETEAQAANTIALLDEADIVFGHVFPYSPRVGTPAARMPQHDLTTIRARARRLREAADARRARWLETLVGTRQSVLIEGESGYGHAANYAPARLASGATRGRAGTNGVVVGDIVTLHITHVENDMLVGETL